MTVFSFKFIKISPLFFTIINNVLVGIQKYLVIFYFGFSPVSIILTKFTYFTGNNSVKYLFLAIMWSINQCIVTITLT